MLCVYSSIQYTQYTHYSITTVLACPLLSLINYRFYVILNLLTYRSSLFAAFIILKGTYCVHFYMIKLTRCASRNCVELVIVTIASNLLHTNIVV